MKLERMSTSAIRPVFGFLIPFLYFFQIRVFLQTRLGRNRYRSPWSVEGTRRT